MAKTPADQFIMSSGATAYLDPAVRQTMAARVSAAREELKNCRACPRLCRANRFENEATFCRIGRHARVASAFAHFGEERCLRGWRGSGTIFFARCNLRCVFCQNWDISQQDSGREMDAGGIADLILALQEQDCHNINLVTPEHVVPHVIEALAAAIDRGLRLPVVYNTSAYDSVASLKLLAGLVDVYMPDFKLWSSDAAARLLKATDYPERAREAIQEMHGQVGDLCLTADGVACRGLLVRHLVMPGLPEESRHIFHWLATEVSPDTFVNVMGQYHPQHKVGQTAGSGGRSGTVLYAEINRPCQPWELAAAYTAAREAGLWRFDE